jgi:hypothetical protein
MEYALFMADIAVAFIDAGNFDPLPWIRYIDGRRWVGGVNCDFRKGYLSFIADSSAMTLTRVRLSQKADR